MQSIIAVSTNKSDTVISDNDDLNDADIASQVQRYYSTHKGEVEAILAKVAAVSLFVAVADCSTSICWHWPQPSKA